MPPEDVRERDVLELTWQECGKRFLRKASRAGREVGLLLPVGSRLRRGDVVYIDGQLVLHVRLVPSRVLVIPFGTSREVAANAYELGCLHGPVQFEESAMIVPYDEPTEARLLRLGIRFVDDFLEFEPDGPTLEVGIAKAFSVYRGNEIQLNQKRDG